MPRVLRRWHHPPDLAAGEAYCSGSRWVAHLESSSSDGLRALHFEEIHTIGDTSHTNDQWVSSFTDGVVGYAGGASYPSLAVRGNTTMYLAFRLASPASLVVIVGSRSSFSSVTLSTTSITGNVRGVNAVDTAGRTYVVSAPPPPPPLFRVCAVVSLAKASCTRATLCLMLLGLAWRCHSVSGMSLA